MTYFGSCAVLFIYFILLLFFFFTYYQWNIFSAFAFHYYADVKSYLFYSSAYVTLNTGYFTTFYNLCKAQMKN